MRYLIIALMFVFAGVAFAAPTAAEGDDPAGKTAEAANSETITKGDYTITIESDGTVTKSITLGDDGTLEVNVSVAAAEGKKTVSVTVSVTGNGSTCSSSSSGDSSASVHLSVKGKK